MARLIALWENSIFRVFDELIGSFAAGTLHPIAVGPTTIQNDNAFCLCAALSPDISSFPTATLLPT